MDMDRLLERLSIEDEDPSTERAPARLKSRIYSALVNRLSKTAPLLSLPATKAEGAQLCVFEELLTRLPVSDGAKSRNPCRVCHARVLGERLERAPIFWPHCPYAAFHDK